MKHAYRWVRPLLAALLLFIAFGASAQPWRPFRPGLIYAYHATPATSQDDYYTLRVDSVYASANGDSVYAFNRRLRTAPSTSGAFNPMARSPNNLFGATLRWRPGQRGYTLEALAQAGVQAAVSFTLFPQTAVGSTWVASSQPAQTATLVSRSWQTVSSGVQDSVAVISIAGATPQTLRLSRRFGLLAGPQWLGGAAGAQLKQALLPAAFAQSLYNPLRFFDVQVGDEFGYSEVDVMATVQCFDNKILRRITSSRLTPDSLIVTYLEQTRNERFYSPGGPCNSPASLTITPIVTKRWALSRTGNQWLPGWPVQLAALHLLTGEYRMNSPGGFPALLAGAPIGSGGGCNSIGRGVSFGPYYAAQAGGNTYVMGLDNLNWGYTFGPGVTIAGEPNFMMTYSRKTVGGVTTICGNPQAFVSLLPTRAAQAASLATLHPNPATESATLTLAQPARAGQTLRLTDALGRQVWSGPVAQGQTLVPVPLGGQQVGLYLLHLISAEGTSATWKLNHE
jgi:hypothetical protein